MIQSPRIPFTELPRVTVAARGGPRYTQVCSPTRQTCGVCGETIAPKHPSAIDRVRTWGRPPRRWCSSCWDQAGIAQVLR